RFSCRLSREAIAGAGGRSGAVNIAAARAGRTGAWAWRPLTIVGEAMHDHGGYRRLGRSGLEVSTLCVGTMMFGDRTDEEEARAILAIARDRGINFIDTADVYSLGESERITGRLIAAERGHWVLATKVANPMSRDPGRRGLSRRWIMRAIDDSLQRLGTD